MSRYENQKSGPAQRNLRAGELVRGLTTSALAGAFCISTAAAEVCDKTIGEGWTSANGPVLYVEHPIGRWVFLVLAAVLTLVWAFRLKWLNLLLLPILILVGLVMLYPLLFPDQMTSLELREGCRSLGSMVADFLIFFSLALISLVLIYRHRKLAR